MPYPSQVNREKIVDTAREFIKTESVDALTLSKLASALNVKAPSLYRHVANKEALLQAVNLRTLQELLAALNFAADSEAAPTSKIMTIVRAYRQFAHANPQLYILAMTAKSGDGRPDEDIMVQMALPMQAVVVQISGEENGLAALRGLFALVHGYVLLELNQQFQREGNLDQTFGMVVEAYLKGWGSK